MTSRSIVSAASAVILALVVAWAPRSAEAEKRIVVLDFEGPKSAGFEKTIIGIVKGEHEYLSSKRFARAAKKTKGFSPDAEGVKKVALKLKAEGIVIGTVEKGRGKRHVITLKVRSGDTGDFVGDDIKVTVLGTKLKGPALRKVKKKLLAAIDDLPELGESGDAAAEDEDAGKAEGEGDAVEDGATLPAEEVADATAEEPAAEVADKTGDDDDDDDKAAAPSASDEADLAVRGRGVDMLAGLSFVGRNLSFGLSNDVADTPQGYEGGLVPALYVGAEVYPMSLGKRGRGVAQNIALTLEFERVLKINSTLEGMEDIDLPTTQQRFGVGALYRWNFGRSPTSPTLKLGVAYNQASFNVDKSGAPAGAVDFPNVAYTYLSPGVELRFPINAKLAALGEAHYLFVTALGEMQEAAQYGAAAITAFDLDLGAEYKVTSSLAARAGFRLTRFGMTFDGSGALTDRDGDDAQDVASATDQYLGFYAMVSYLF